MPSVWTLLLMFGIGVSSLFWLAFMNLGYKALLVSIVARPGYTHTHIYIYIFNVDTCV